MKKNCVQCGKEFELTRSEIDFYKQKGLSIPKRCKECRDANKKAGKSGAGQNKKTQNQVMQGRLVPDVGKHGKAGGNSRIIIAVAAVVLALLLAGGSGIASMLNEWKQTDAYLSSMEAEAASRVSAESAEMESKAVAESADVESRATAESAEAESRATAESAEAESKAVAESADVESRATAESAEAESRATAESAEMESKAVAESAEAESKAVAESAEMVSYRFRSKKLLNQHYEKHGIEMGFANAADYEAAAAAVISNPNALYKTEQEDGDGVYFVEETNEFVILSTDGYIRTYFNPSGGIDYFNRQ